MNTNILKIKDDLLNDRINYSSAFELIKTLPKSWKTTEWQNKRKILLKSHCEQCGDNKNILVAQHLSHPRKFSEIRQELLFKMIRNSNWADEENSKPIIVTEKEIELFKQQNSIKRLSCPNCFHVSFRERKTMQPRFKCYHCNTLFDSPVEILYSALFQKKIDLVDIKSFLLHYKIEERKIYISQSIYKNHEEELGKQALLLSIEEHLKYTSLNNIVTFCKKCAAKMDLTNQLLCYDCKENYFDYALYDNCFLCNKNGLKTINPFKQKIFDFGLNDNC